MRTNYKTSKHLLARVIFIAITLLAYACGNTQEQKSAPAAGLAPESDAGERLMAASQADGAGEESTTDSSSLYSVDCGQVNDAGETICYVDGDTYIGWRTYHAFCHVCHAQDAVGSTFAPNLLDRMREPDMNLDLFVERVRDGYTGQVGVMPPWKDNPNVSKRYKELYVYLMARASNDLRPGRPTKKPKSN